MEMASGRRCQWWTCCALVILATLHLGSAYGSRGDDKEKSITCYQCNSEYDPRCGDPFDPFTLGTVNCSMKRPLEHMHDVKPVLCRKTTQKVQGKIRVIRGCGYVRDERDDGECMKRSGTHDVQVHYCSCTKNLCNSAMGAIHIETHSICMLLPSLVLMALTTLLLRQ